MRMVIKSTNKDLNTGKSLFCYNKFRVYQLFIISTYVAVMDVLNMNLIGKSIISVDTLTAYISKDILI